MTQVHPTSEHAPNVSWRLWLSWAFGSSSVLLQDIINGQQSKKLRKWDAPIWAKASDLYVILSSIMFPAKKPESIRKRKKPYWNKGVSVVPNKCEIMQKRRFIEEKNNVLVNWWPLCAHVNLQCSKNWRKKKVMFNPCQEAWHSAGQYSCVACSPVSSCLTC